MPEEALGEILNVLSKETLWGMCLSSAYECKFISFFGLYRMPKWSQILYWRCELSLLSFSEIFSNMRLKKITVWTAMDNCKMSG